MRYWVNTVSRDHVQRGVAGGFTQADHGKDTRLKRMSKGDRIVFYSPRTEFPAGEALQRFTALGEIADDRPYQVEMKPDFHPWRRQVRFAASEEAPIHPLIESLEFFATRRVGGSSSGEACSKSVRPTFRGSRAPCAPLRLVSPDHS